MLLKVFMVIDVSDGKVGLKLVVSVFCIYLCIFFFLLDYICIRLNMYGL